MACTPAPACRVALDEASRLWPNRNRASDGICGDPAHASRTSDHNPNAQGFATAFDLTHDPGHGVYCGVLSEMIRQRRDPRVKYIIWNRRIWNPSVSSAWRPYSGANPHTLHMHVSIYDHAVRNTAQWWYIDEDKPLPDDPNIPNLRDIKFFVPIVREQDGFCTGYYMVSSVGEVHGWGPGAKYHGRSEVPT